MSQHSLTSAPAKALVPMAGEAGVLKHLWWNFADTYIVMKRNLMYFVREPQLLIFATVQPIMFLVLFTYVFGGVISFSTGGDYINYLMPGIVIQSIIFASSNTTVGLSLDLSRGMIDRFRSLPMSRAAVLAGRTAADTVRGFFTISIMLMAGYVIGFRFADWGTGLAGLLLAVAFGYAFTWISATIGLLVKDPEAAQVAGFIWLFPLTFASSIFVPTRTMPDWLRTFAENQPVSIVAGTVRELMTGTVNPDGIATSLAWIIGIVVVFMPLAVRQYAKVASR
ncbi:MAG: ABC transporter permease [Anaerolineae bacterium]|nr:ABC transporter permease [Anaerolineae bacterium]